MELIIDNINSNTLAVVILGGCGDGGGAVVYRNMYTVQRAVP